MSRSSTQIGPVYLRSGLLIGDEHQTDSEISTLRRVLEAKGLIP